MSLREYHRKRDFKVTAEPSGEKVTPITGSSFVVQKHDATRLHFDLRLEMEGVLKSWAVPKGFPTEKGERHLAVEVEDHPLDYAGFEGIIPKGQYGGGTVMVWDYGHYRVGGDDPPRAWKEGKLHCFLEGTKLKGEWTLVRSSHSGDERNWFLIKTGEGMKPFTKKAEEHSAVSGRTLAQIAKQQTAVWHSNRPEKGPAKVEAEEKEKVLVPPKKKPASRARVLPPPAWVEPMKATLLAEPPPGDDWLYELKWDGYRALALKGSAEVQLVSRNQKSLTADFPEIAEALASLPARTAILDGEICALDTEGRPAFQLLQAREMGQGRPPLYFYAFDLLELEGKSLLNQPLIERKAALEKLLAAGPDLVRYSAAIEGDVKALLHELQTRGMEGLIGKLKDSTYQPGVRSKAWVKLKVHAEQEFVIGGCTPPQGSRKHFGALLVGYYEGKTLRFAGKVGTGFNEAWLKRLAKEIGQRKTVDAPFSDLPKKATGRWNQGISKAEMRRCTWCRPELVCQLKFTEWTNEGSLRHPVFLGLREDKAPQEVGRERGA